MKRDEIVLATQEEAGAIIGRLAFLIATYKKATVSDFYAMMGLDSNYGDTKHGWTDMIDAKVCRVNHGYVLDLPSTMELE